MTNLSADLSQQKQAWREKLRFRRRHFVAHLDPLARLTAFHALPVPLAQLLGAHEWVGAYIAAGEEPDIVTPLSETAALALPHHQERSALMTFRQWHPSTPLEKGPWGTQQAAEQAKAATPSLIFCPLVGFDRRGRRLGQGGGHYDRYCAAYPDARRIGVAWSVQEIDTIPCETTDVALDAIWTEQEYIECGDRL